MDGNHLLLIPLVGLFLLASQYTWAREPRTPAPTLATTANNSGKSKPASPSPTLESQPNKLHSVDTFTVGLKRLGNINLPWSSPKYGLRGDTNFCVFSGSGAYRVTLSNQAGDGRFYLENNRFKLPIDIYYNDKPGTQGRRILREGVMLSGLMSRNRKPSCQGLSANLSVVISPQDLHSAQAGKYRGWFFLEISPE